MSKKYGFKNYTVLDRRQFDLLMWNLMKTLSNNTEQVSSLLLLHTLIKIRRQTDV